MSTYNRKNSIFKFLFGSLFFIEVYIVCYEQAKKSIIQPLLYKLQNEKNNFAIGTVLNEYLEFINNTDPLQAETYENSYYILSSFYRNVNNTPGNYTEATKNLIKLK